MSRRFRPGPCPRRWEPGSQAQRKSPGASARPPPRPPSLPPTAVGATDITDHRRLVAIAPRRSGVLKTCIGHCPDAFRSSAGMFGSCSATIHMPYANAADGMTAFEKRYRDSYPGPVMSFIYHNHQPDALTQPLRAFFSLRPTGPQTPHLRRPPEGGRPNDTGKTLNMQRPRGRFRPHVGTLEPRWRLPKPMSRALSVS